MRTFKNSSVTAQAIVLFLAFVGIYLLGVAMALALNKDRPAYFLPEERKIIYQYYHRSSPSKGLPPGLAKKGKLPPGLQKQLDKNGKLPPGLQKRLEPLPQDLKVRLPQLPEYWERVILERNVILIDRRTQRILDIIENVMGWRREVRCFTSEPIPSRQRASRSRKSRRTDKTAESLIRFWGKMERRWLGEVRQRLSFCWQLARRWQRSLSLTLGRKRCYPVNRFYCRIC